MSANQENIEALLCAYVDGELSPRERADVDRQLAGNPKMRKVVSELVRVRGMVRALPRASAPPDLLEDFQSQMERAALLGGAGAEEEADVIIRISRWPQFLSAAAIILLAVGLGMVVYFVLPHGRGTGQPVAMNTDSKGGGVRLESTEPPPGGGAGGGVVALAPAEELLRLDGSPLVLKDGSVAMAKVGAGSINLVDNNDATVRKAEAAVGSLGPAGQQKQSQIADSKVAVTPLTVVVINTRDTAAANGAVQQYLNDNRIAWADARAEGAQGQLGGQQSQAQTSQAQPGYALVQAGQNAFSGASSTTNNAVDPSVILPEPTPRAQGQSQAQTVGGVVPQPSNRLAAAGQAELKGQQVGAARPLPEGIANRSGQQLFTNSASNVNQGTLNLNNANTFNNYAANGGNLTQTSNMYRAVLNGRQLADLNSAVRRQDAQATWSPQPIRSDVIVLRPDGQVLLDNVVNARRPVERRTDAPAQAVARAAAPAQPQLRRSAEAEVQVAAAPAPLAPAPVMKEAADKAGAPLVWNETNPDGARGNTPMAVKSSKAAGADELADRGNAAAGSFGARDAMALAKPADDVDRAAAKRALELSRAPGGGAGSLPRVESPAPTTAPAATQADAAATQPVQPQAPAVEMAQQDKDGVGTDMPAAPDPDQPREVLIVISDQSPAAASPAPTTQPAAGNMAVQPDAPAQNRAPEAVPVESPTNSASAAPASQPSVTPSVPPAVTPSVAPVVPDAPPAQPAK